MKLHNIPDSLEIQSIVNEAKLFIYDVNSVDGVIRGFTVTDSSSVELVWSIDVIKSHKIVGVAAKHPFEKVPIPRLTQQ